MQKSYDGQTKWIYFLIEDNDLLEKFNIIWAKVSANIKKIIWQWAKINSSRGETTNFCDKEIIKVKSKVTSLKSAPNKDGTVFCKCLKKNSNTLQLAVVIRHITDLSYIYYSDKYDEECIT